MIVSGERQGDIRPGAAQEDVPARRAGADPRKPHGGLPCARQQTAAHPAANREQQLIVVAASQGLVQRLEASPLEQAARGGVDGQGVGLDAYANAARFGNPMNAVRKTVAEIDARACGPISSQPHAETNPRIGSQIRSRESLVVSGWSLVIC